MPQKLATDVSKRTGKNKHNPDCRNEFVKLVWDRGQEDNSLEGINF